MIKSVTDLQTLDMEVGIMTELHESLVSESLLLLRLRAAFGKDYITEDLNNLKRYHDFINQRGQFETLDDFTIEWYDQVVK